MNALHALFRTDKYNLSKVGAHFINPCCYGEDLAAWIHEKLSEKGIAAHEPYQEDWGWEFAAQINEQSYYLGVGGNADGATANPDEGEWRVIVEKKRTLWQRLAGENKSTLDDPLLSLIKQILIADTRIRDVRVEKG
jgi:hypothetical protein